MELCVIQLLNLCKSIIIVVVGFFFFFFLNKKTEVCVEKWLQAYDFDLHSFEGL